MSNWKKYRRTKITEMRPVTKEEADSMTVPEGVSVSENDREQLGCPKLGDMIARDPNNHNDQWLVSYEYYSGNFEEIG
jgi:hypothetical protein